MSRAHRLVVWLIAWSALCPLATGDLHAQLRKGRALRPETKTCLDCHRKEAAAFGAKSSRHAPVAAGSCESCHLKHGVVGVNRLAAEDPQLCLACHAMAGEPATGKGTGAGGKGSGAATKTHLFTHPPAEALRCGTCHDAHASDAPHLLKAAGAATCVSCHKSSELHGPSMHPAGAVDCLSCHDPHGSTIAASLSKEKTALCVSCHNGKSEAERGSHGGASPPPGACLDCHTPHAAPTKGLMRSHVHPPMAETPGGCATCHVEGGRDSEPFALVAPAPDLCLSCHDDPRKTVATAGGGAAPRVHPPVAEGACLSCHTPHASDQEGLLRTRQQELCGNVHSESKQAAEARAPHPPARQDCTSCHLPHSGPPGLVRAPPPELCGTCHAGVKEQTARAHVHPPAAEGDCLACHDPHGSAQQGILRQPATALCITCHDGMRTELESRVPHPPAKQGACVSCHEPHGSSAEHLVAADLSAACLRCHAREGLASSTGHLHAPFAGGDCLACHRPHGSAREGLLTMEAGVLCRSCHGDLEGERTATTRHTPVMRGQCLACHDPHGGHTEALLRRADIKSMCLSCHVDEGRMMARQDVTIHPPFKNDSCLTCHGAHASTQEGLLAKPAAMLCAGCHDAAQPAMTAPHKGLITSVTDCTGCHEPHASASEKLLLADQHPPFGQGDCGACHQGGRK